MLPSQSTNDIAPGPRFAVPGAHHRWGKRPLDCERWVVMGDSDILARFVRPVDPVANIGCVGKCLKSVQKARRYEQVIESFVVQLKCANATECRRVRSSVHYYVENGAVRAPDKLGLSPAQPSVQTANGSADRSRLGVLSEHGGRDGRVPDSAIEYLAVERSGEQASVISERLRHVRKQTLYVTVNHSHKTIIAYRPAIVTPKAETR